MLERLLSAGCAILGGSCRYSLERGQHECRLGFRCDRIGDVGCAFVVVSVDVVRAVRGR